MLSHLVGVTGVWGRGKERSWRGFKEEAFEKAKSRVFITKTDKNGRGGAGRGGTGRRDESAFRF